jgi:hypothetical protein
LLSIDLVILPCRGFADTGSGIIPLTGFSGWVGTNTTAAAPGFSFFIFRKMKGRRH